MKSTILFGLGSAIGAPVVLLGLLASSLAPAGAQTLDELKEERKRIAEEEADAALLVDMAGGDVDTVVDALNAVQDRVDSLQGELADAERAVLMANLGYHLALNQVTALEERISATQLELHDSVVEAFVSFQAPVSNAVLLGGDPWRNARSEVLVGFATGSRLDGIDELRLLGAELEDQQRLADEAEAEAQALREEVSQRLAEFETARDGEAKLLATAESRLETRLFEVEALRDQDAELAAAIAREERRIAEALARERARRAAAAAAAAAASLPPDANIELESVGGFVVNSRIAGATRGLLDAMAAEGFVLGGGSYRSSASQIVLRRAHCGTSDYAVWQMPASQCRPPTARPGRSDHERGLAIDFSHNGRIISSRNSAVFQAMRRIAPGYGFTNLPSEPWHWSAG